MGDIHLDAPCFDLDVLPTSLGASAFFGVLPALLFHAAARPAEALKTGWAERGYRQPQIQ